MPIRVQRKRTAGWRMPPNTVYVGRPTKWGNPYYGPNFTPEEAVNAYRFGMTTRTDTSPDLWWLRRRAQIDELRGRNLACWCSLDQPCHVDVLLELANT